MRSFGDCVSMDAPSPRSLLLVLRYGPKSGLPEHNGHSGLVAACGCARPDDAPSKRSDAGLTTVEPPPDAGGRTTPTRSMKQLTSWLSVWSCSFSATSLGSVTLLSAWFPLFALRHKPALLGVRGGPHGIPRRRAQGHVPEGSETSARARREWPRRVAVATAVRLGKRARPAAAR
jgi:hypothetical protein